MAFIVKAFGKEILRDIIIKRDFPSHVVRPVRSLYVNTSFMLSTKISHRRSESGIPIETRVLVIN